MPKRMPTSTLSRKSVPLSNPTTTPTGAQMPNSYKPMVTAPPAPQDPAHPNLVNPGAPAITAPGSVNGVIVPSVNSRMPVIKPLAPSNMPVFPPAGSPGGNPNVVPK